ncbi:MAG: ATP synthase F1 subunit delta [Acidobacteriota bacterium]
MASFNQDDAAIAGVYAQSLFDLAQAEGRADDVHLELQQFAKLLDDHADFARVVESPLVDLDARKALLEKALRGNADDLVVNTLQVLNRKGRLPLVRAVVAEFSAIYKRTHGIVDVVVRTAIPLSAALRKRIEAVAARITGGTPSLTEEVDPSLLGGIVLLVGDRKYDASLAKDLHEVRQRLAVRSSRAATASITA